MNIFNTFAAMKVKYGEIVTNGNGKLGGHTNYRTSKGNIVRTVVSGTNRQNYNQVKQRIVFGRVAREWRLLTQMQRDEWNSVAIGQFTIDRFGDRIPLTGNNLFCIVNITSLRAGMGFIHDPVPPSETPVITEADPIYPTDFRYNYNDIVNVTTPSSNIKFIVYSSQWLPISAATDYSQLVEVCQFEPIERAMPSFTQEFTVMSLASLFFDTFPSVPSKMLFGLSAFIEELPINSERYENFGYYEPVTGQSPIIDSAGGSVNLSLQRIRISINGFFYAGSYRADITCYNGVNSIDEINLTAFSVPENINVTVDATGTQTVNITVNNSIYIDWSSLTSGMILPVCINLFQAGVFPGNLYPIWIKLSIS